MDSEEVHVHHILFSKRLLNMLFHLNMFTNIHIFDYPDP